VGHPGLAHSITMGELPDVIRNAPGERLAYS
jgi:hypothetical protein